MAAERVGTLDALVDHGHATRSFFLRLAEPLAFRPGQFVSCLLPLDGGMIRPYSIASDPEAATRIELLLNLVPGGPGSAYLFGLGEGATVRFTGPWGTFICDRAPAAETVFIAEGTGIAPIRPMVRRALATAEGRRVRLLHAAARPGAFVYRSEMEAAAPALSIEHIVTEDLATEVHRRWVDADDDRTRHFFVCGVGSVVPAVRDLLRAAGYERRAVQYERW